MEQHEKQRMIDTANHNFNEYIKAINYFKNRLTEEANDPEYTRTILFDLYKTAGLLRDILLYLYLEKK